MRRAVGRNQEIGGDNGEAGGRYRGHAQRQTDFEIEPRAVPHRRAPGANGFVATALNGRTHPAQSHQAPVRCTVVKFSRPSPGPAPLHGLMSPSRLARRSVTRGTFMHLRRLILSVCLLVLPAAYAPAGAETAIGVAMDDFSYTDTSA